MTNGSRVMVTASWRVQLEISSEQIKLSGQIWTLRPLPEAIWKNSEYKDPRKFYNLSNEG
jgi:hypothetical protein